MRQFTEAEKEAQLIDWVACPDMSPEYSGYEIHRDGFTAGLDHAAEQLAALTAERDSLRVALEEIAAGNPAPPGKWLTDIQMAQIAWRALEGSADEQKQEIRH